MEERKFTAAAYARTDHDHGKQSWDDINRQQSTNSAAATRMGIQVVAGFVDIGQPSDQIDRPGIRHLLAYAEQHPFDYAIVASIDRLAENAEHLNPLLLRLAELGIKVLMADHDTEIELVLPSNTDVARQPEGGDHE